MTLARLLSASLVLVSSLAVAADKGAPAAARQRLEAARAAVAAAVQRIEKDPPSTPDLDAALAAVEALKVALDDGAAFEAQDLEYARSALLARKELRTQRAYVEDRRSKIQLHEQRRALDGLAAALADRIRALGAKAPDAKAFDDARAAAAAFKKGLDDARPLAKQDEKFAAFLSQASATLANQEKAIDDRWTALSADKHRALVTEARKTLSGAMAPLTKDSTDAQIDGATRAAAALGKLIDDGKPLEAKDATYRTDADRARGEVAQATKRLDDLVSETRLARLKAEIEPAYKDLQAAGRAVRSRGATADQLAEARTAAIVVRKLVEKLEPQAAVSKAFGAYMADVKKGLAEVEIELERRALTVAQRDATTALRALEKRAPANESFDEAKTALSVLEKTLETVHVKAPELSAYVGDARILLREGPKQIAKRRLELDVEAQKAKVEEARKSAGTAMGKLSQPTPSAEVVQEAEAAIKQIGVALEAGAELTKRDRGYAAYASEVKKRIGELENKLASRKLSLLAAAARASLTEAVAAAKVGIETAKKPEATDADLDAAAKAVEAIGKAAEAGASLREKDRGYAAHVERVEMDFIRLSEALELARQGRALRKQTGEALSAGRSAAEAAAASADLRARRDGYEKAHAAFKTCATASGSIEATPAFARLVVLVDGRPSTAKEVVAACAQQAESAAQQLDEVKKVIAFDEGPKRAYERAKTLLGKGNKNEALTQLYECISSGAILQGKHPELKERKFDAGGSSLTLAEVIQWCVQQRDAIKPPQVSTPMKK